MTSEWREIDFADADISLLGVTKITDVSHFLSIVVSGFFFLVLCSLLYASDIWSSPLYSVSADAFKERRKVVSLENYCIRESNTLHIFKRRLKSHLTSLPS